MNTTPFRAISSISLLGLLLGACSSDPALSGNQDGGTSAVMDAGGGRVDSGARARSDVTRQDATRPSASRTDAGRPDSGMRRDAGGSTMTGQTVPTGEVHIVEYDGNECLSAWIGSGESDRDYAYVFLQPCDRATDNRWRFLPVSGSPGVYQLTNSSFKDTACIGINEGGIWVQTQCLDDTSAQWRVLYEGDQFRLQNVGRANTCIEAYDGEYAFAATCSTTVDGQYFFTRPAP